MQSCKKVIIALFFLIGVIPCNASDLPTLRPSLSFEPNKGQAAGDILFLSRSSVGNVLLTDEGLMLQPIGSASVSISFARSGALSETPVAEAPTGGFANYYPSGKRAAWLEHIPLFKSVRYPSVYSGVDILVHGHEDQLELDFQVAPGASLEGIRFSVEGSERLSLGENGALNITAGTHVWHLLLPFAYQYRGKNKVPVQVQYRLLENNQVGLQAGPYDSTSKLVIDPVVEYSNIRTISNYMNVTSFGMDADGKLVLAGETSAQDFPVVEGQGASSEGNSQAFIAKMSPADGSIVYSTYFPSSASTGINSLAFDSEGNTYVAGGTSGSDFPLTSTNLGSCASSCDAGFVVKLSSSGSIIYSTLLASTGVSASAIAVDANGSAYVVGSITSDALQTVNAFQPDYKAGICTTCSSGFFAKLDPSGTNYLFSSYFGGSNGAELSASAIALDQSGDIFISGSVLTAVPTLFPDIIPLVKPWQSVFGEYFLSKFAPDGKTLLFSTRFGGTSAPSTNSLAGMQIGTDGTVYLVGYTASPDFPYALNVSANALLPGVNASSGAFHMFAAAVDPDLAQLKYSSYLGDGMALAMTLDGQSHLYVAGTRSGSHFLPLINPVVSDNSPQGFFLELDTNGNPLITSKFGGSQAEQIPTAIAIDNDQNIYLSGLMSPQSFPNPFAPDPILVGPQTGGNDGYGFFLAKLGPANAPELNVISPNGASSDLYAPFLIVRNLGSSALSLSSIALGGGLSQKITNCGTNLPAGGSCILTVADSNGHKAAGSVTITSNAQPSIQVFNVTLAPNTLAGSPIGDWPFFEDVNTEFPSQLSGTSTGTVPLRIWNLGTENSQVDSVLTVGPVSQTNDCGMLPPGANCTVQISATPVDPNTPGGQVNILYDGNINSSSHPGNHSQEQTISVFSPPSAQQVLLSATDVGFGTQVVGGVAIPRIITVTNTDNSSIGAPGASISGSTNFSVSGNTCTAPLPSHGSCMVAVTFVPTVNGQQLATLTVGGGPHVNLSGTGLSGSLVSVSAPAINFSAVVITQTGTMDLTLTNPSNSGIDIASINISQPEFGQINDCGGQIAAAGSCTVHATFTPQVLGAEAADMTIIFSQGVAQAVSLSGTGVTPLDVTATVLDFAATTPVGGTSSPQSVAISNAQSAGSQAYSTTITGDFVIAGSTCPNPVPASAGCAIRIAFQPKQSGLQQGQLVVSYPGLSAQSIVALRGDTSNTAPLLTFQPSSGSSTSATVTAGQKATFQLDAAAASGFNGTMEFACTGAPSRSTCSVKPGSFDFSQAASTNLSIEVATTAASAKLKNRRVAFFYAIALGLPLLVATRRRPGRKGLLLVVLALFIYSGCGGGSSSQPPPSSSGTPPGTYTLTVAGTSNIGQPQTVSLTLTVQ